MGKESQANSMDVSAKKNTFLKFASKGEVVSRSIDSWSELPPYLDARLKTPQITVCSIR